MTSRGRPRPTEVVLAQGERSPKARTLPSNLDSTVQLWRGSGVVAHLSTLTSAATRADSAA